jgi:hypothetical protein
MELEEPTMPHTAPPVTFVLQAAPDPDVPWGEHGIDALIWGEAEPEPAASGQPPAKASPPTTDLSPEEEAYLGHA